MTVSRRNVARPLISHALIAFVSLFAVACGQVLAVDGEVPDPVTPAAIDFAASGGIVAIQYHAHIDSASGNFTYSRTNICAQPSECPVLNSGAGTLARGAVDALFQRTAAPEFRALRADYGVTADAADMMTYTLTIHLNARSRRVQADDGTMPTVMAQFVHDVQGATTAK